MAFPAEESDTQPRIIKNKPWPADVQIVTSLKPLWIALQAVGLYPVHTADRDGVVPSTAVLYATLCYAILTVLLATAALSAPRDANDEPADFDSSVSAYAMYLLLALPAVMPPFYFFSRIKLHRYLVAWAEFEEEFVATTGTPLQLPTVRWWPVVLGAGVWPAAGGALMLPLLSHADRPLWLAALAAHSAAESSLLAAAAALNCRAARSAARDIANSLCNYGDNAMVLEAHRCLWLRLSRLVRDLGAGLVGPLSALLLSHFSLLTLASYALLGSLLGSASLPVPAAAFLVATAAATLATCCNSGHQTTNKVRGVVEDKLEAMREEPSTPIWLYKMFDVFLKTMASFPAKIDLAGMTTLNRGLLTSFKDYATENSISKTLWIVYHYRRGVKESVKREMAVYDAHEPATAMVSTMVTYLVVIVQFRVSHEVLKISRNGGGTNAFSAKGQIPMNN